VKLLCKNLVVIVFILFTVGAVTGVFAVTVANVVNFMCNKIKSILQVLDFFAHEPSPGIK